MTAKEKAKELIEKYKFVYIQNYTSMHEVKECAIITVQEVLFEVNRLDLKFNLGLEGTRQYWNEVKKEIENL